MEITNTFKFLFWVLLIGMGIACVEAIVAGEFLEFLLAF